MARIDEFYELAGVVHTCQTCAVCDTITNDRFVKRHILTPESKEGKTA